MNVVPSQLSAYFDIRVNPWVDLDEMDKQLRAWCREAGEDVLLEFVAEKLRKPGLTSIQPGDIW